MTKKANVSGRLGKPGDVQVLVSGKYSFIQWHVDDSGDTYDFFDVYLGSNATMVSMPPEDFEEVLDMFREFIEEESLDEHC